MWKQTKNGYLPPFVLRSSSAHVVQWLTQALYSLSDEYMYSKLFIGLCMGTGVVREDKSEETQPGDKRLARVTLQRERWLTSDWLRERRLTSDWSRERRLTFHRSRERGAGGGSSGVPGREVRRGVCGAGWELKNLSQAGTASPFWFFFQLFPSLHRETTHSSSFSALWEA